MIKQWQKRPPAVAGQFYPAQPQALQQKVDQLLAAAVPKTAAGQLRALIVPHAGYQYSGRTAGKAFALAQLQADFERVVILAPSHHLGMSQVSVGHYDRYSTPLGDMRVDVNACKQLLMTGDLFNTDVNAHAAEHALEVQVPFVQTILPQAQLIPLVCGQLNRGQINAVAEILVQQFWDRRTLWIVSSDFTHYGHAFGYVPFQTNVRRRLHELDRGAIAYIEQLDSAGFLDYVERTEATICGSVPIAILLSAAAHAAQPLKSRLLEYITSGDMTHDYTHSVSYAALAICEDMPASLPVLELTDSEQHFLLDWAQAAIDARLQGTEPAEPEPHHLTPTLLQPAATFVTLHLDGNLRGCIGEMQPRLPLYRSVSKNAQAAAFADSRFRPISAAEAAALHLEITVLSALQPIDSTAEIKLGRHGIHMEKNGYSAVFLPQVPVEQNWDLQTTLHHLSAKAGLPAAAWQHGTRFHVFEAFIFAQQ